MQGERSGLLKALGDDRLKISQKQADVSQMDQIKVVTMEPGVVNIFNDEPEVGRYPGLLNRAQVKANHLGAGKLVRH